MQGKKDFLNGHLLSFWLWERILRGNFYRRQKNILGLSWLYDTAKSCDGTKGHKFINQVVFFKLLLIGYLENPLVDRRIIQVKVVRFLLLLVRPCMSHP